MKTFSSSGVIQKSWNNLLCLYGIKEEKRTGKLFVTSVGEIAPEDSNDLHASELLTQI